MICGECQKPMKRGSVVRLSRTYFRPCGDHDEGVQTHAVVLCSWSCATAWAAKQPLESDVF